MLIELMGIHKVYKTGPLEVKALTDINISVEKGELIAIVGPSGSGKSTLLKILGCLDIPTEGKYYFNGEDIFTLNDNQLSEIRNKYIGFVFQNFNLIPRLNVIENIEIPLLYSSSKKKYEVKKIYELLELVGMSDRAHHRPSELSGGQQQRVAIARALINDPYLILADEPTGNLDSKSAKDIINLLQELNRAGRTVIIVTHDNFVASSAPRRIYIQDGMIIKDEKV